MQPASWRSGSVGSELGYAQITATVNIASTTEGTGTTLISPGAITFDGGAVICEVFSPILATSTQVGATIVSLFESSTQIGRLGGLTNGSAVQVVAPFRGMLRFTPTAGAHTYTVTGHANSTTGTPSFGAGASGTGAYVPAYIRFVKV